MVTGASKGIGLAVIRALVAEGARWSPAPGRAAAELDELVDDGAVAPGRGRPDRTRRPGTAGRPRPLQHGGIDVLVNNVGAVRPRLDGFLAITDDDWARL